MGGVANIARAGAFAAIVLISLHCFIDPNYFQTRRQVPAQQPGPAGAAGGNVSQVPSPTAAWPPAASAAAVPTAVPTSEPTPSAFDVRLVNGTMQEICHLYLSPTSEANWGEDRLEASPALQVGGAMAVALNRAVSSWDLLAQDCSRQPVAQVFGQGLPPDNTWVIYAAVQQPVPNSAGAGGALPLDSFWVAADAQIESFTGRGLFFQGTFADALVGSAARPPAEILGTEAILRRVVWRFGADPATVLFLGDAGQVACRQEVNALLRWFNELRVPWVFVPGNHDCVPLGAISSDGLLGLPYRDMQRRWEEACWDPLSEDAGAANKYWLVERTRRQFEAVRAAQPAASQEFWASETSTAEGLHGPPSSWDQHLNSWILQVFPIGQPTATGSDPVTVVVALDTTDWTEPGVFVSTSPGSEGCVSNRQARAAVSLFAEVTERIRSQHPQREIRPVVVGHHPTREFRVNTCKPPLADVLGGVGASTYISAHTHEAAAAAAVSLVTSARTTLSVQENNVGSVVEHGSHGERAEVERFVVGSGGRVTRRQQIQTAALVQEDNSIVAGVCCEPIWGATATDAETTAYQHGVLTDRAKSIWLQLSLDHLRQVGQWCSNGGAGSRCATPSGACSTVYRDADDMFDRLAHASFWDDIDPEGARYWTFANAPWTDFRSFLGCVRQGLGLDETDPGRVDPEIERFVVCSALRASAREKNTTYDSTDAGSGGTGFSNAACGDARSASQQLLVGRVSASFSPSKSDGENWDWDGSAPDVKGTLRLGCEEPRERPLEAVINALFPARCVATIDLDKRQDQPSAIWSPGATARLWPGALIEVSLVDGDAPDVDDTIDTVRFYFDGPREYVARSSGSLRELRVRIDSVALAQSEGSAAPDVTTASSQPWSRATINVTVAQTKPDGRRWDFEVFGDGPPDLAICLATAGETRCYPGGGEAITTAGCSDALSCVFADVFVPPGSFSMTIYDVDTEHHDEVGTGTCGLDQQCSIGSANVVIR